MAPNCQRLQKKTGFYPEPLQFTAGPISVAPLPEFEQAIADMLTSATSKRLDIRATSTDP